MGVIKGIERLAEKKGLPFRVVEEAISQSKWASQGRQIKKIVEVLKDEGYHLTEEDLALLKGED